MEAYGYLKDGQIVAPVAMCSRFNDIGAWHTLTDEQRMIHGWYPCTVENNIYDPVTQYQGLTQPILLGNRILIKSSILYKELALVKEESLKKLKSEISMVSKKPFHTSEGVFYISDLERLKLLCISDTDVLFIEAYEGVVMLHKNDLINFVKILNQYDQKLKSILYQAQEKIKNALTVEEVIKVSAYEELVALLEN